MSGEPVPLNNQQAKLVLPGIHAIERRILIIAAVVLLHVVLLSVGAVASAVVTARQVWFLPKAPLLITLVSLLLAHVSLCSIWWARTNWSPHTKTLALLILSGCLWLLLVATLKSARSYPIIAAAWASALILQSLLTGFGIFALELSCHYQFAAARSRFSLAYLMLWTTITALLLAAAGALAARHGFKISDVPDWRYYKHLQAVGLANAALAVVSYASVRLPRNRKARGLAVAATIIAAAIAIPLIMRSAFGDSVGASPADLAWLFSAEASFLMATLMPLVTSQTETSGT